MTGSLSGQIIPNFAITAVGADGTISFTNDSPGTVQLIADTMGYFNGPVTGGLPGPHQLQSMTSTPATGTPATSTFTWDAAGRMTGRAGETLSYTADGKLATTTGSSALPGNPNPSTNAGTPPAPVSGTAGSTGTRYYDAGGNLVGITDGTGTTVMIGSITAHVTPGGVKTATKSYGLAGKTIAQRTAAGGAVKLAFVLSDGVGTAQTIVQASSGATPVTAQTRYTDPIGLARGPTQTAPGTGAYATAGAGVTGVGANAANAAGFGAVNGYIGGLADTVSTLTHLGARDLDPVLGTFTAPDPILDTANPNNYSPYGYANADPVNGSDPSGLMINCECGIGIGFGSWSMPSGGAAAGAAAVGAVGVGAIMSLPTVFQKFSDWLNSLFASSSATAAAEANGFAADQYIPWTHITYPAAPAGPAVSTTPADTPESWGPADGYTAGYPEATGTSFPAIPQRPSSTNDGAGNDGAALAAANAIMHAASQAATQAIANGAAAANAAIPSVVFSRSRAPGLAQNFDDAVSAGAPTELNRVTGRVRDRNRRDALRGQAPAVAGLSLDEYPFACSAQGGAGSCVSPVPVAEQSYQGGVLSRFFQINGIQAGDPFNVIFGP
ncbi:NucA/NucB deoxyribonuclease domain-containing protein [Arthrobacter bambusae]|uniref:NucA/NucB deoxyribonuclease domain-containing protein n=1 Tax=Arthrobacter bambusae TaxID=1338426 RepID=UPI002787CAC4|nr:RHS repeat-associated core domain-containing protein [Arthrobacter bambusae]MDQ0238926.1 RHS repeat-associated protein [Arthrobacter bambusae]